VLPAVGLAELGAALHALAAPVNAAPLPSAHRLRRGAPPIAEMLRGLPSRVCTRQSAPRRDAFNCWR
jgi:hypothetical protein